MTRYPYYLRPVEPARAQRSGTRIEHARRQIVPAVNVLVLLDAEGSLHIPRRTAAVEAEVLL